MTTFNVPCTLTKHHFVARVFENKKEMYAYYIYFSKTFKAKKTLRKMNFGAIVMPYERYKFVGKKRVAVKSKDIGEILFYKDRMGAGIVAHEMGHAAMFWDRHIKGNAAACYGTTISSAEERMLMCLYHLVRNFTNKCHRLGLYPE